MNRRILTVLLFGLVWVALGGSFISGAYADPPTSIDFTRQVLPILQAHCYECHGTANTRGGLRLSTRDDVLQGGGSGKPAVVPGKNAESPLVLRITSDKPGERMPKGKDPLNADDIALLRAWVDQGASWAEGAASDGSNEKKFWSFQAPKVSALPEVKQKDWVRNPIDTFILAHLEKQGLHPTAEADKYALIRRLSLDLIGLPPSPDEVNAFVHDEGPDAYERLVDRLLASPHYGERQAIGWLDAARYADTNGFEKDRARTVWPYRDWVIDAFNRDLPYDRFIVEQLAGDMLPNPTVDQRIATGFLCNSMLNEEGGVDQEEYRYYAVVDRTNTVATVLLGLTMGCAQCHSHKFDPVTQREYYQFQAFLNNSNDVLTAVPNPKISSKRAEGEAKIAHMVEELPKQFPIDEPQTAWGAVQPATAISKDGSTLTINADKSVTASGTAPDADTYTLTFEADPVDLTGVRIEALVDDALPQHGPGRAANGNFVLSEIEVSAEAPDGKGTPNAVKIARAETDHEQTGFSVANAIDGKNETGWGIDGAKGPLNVDRTATFWFDEPLRLANPTKLTVTLEQRFGSGHTLGKFRLSVGKNYIPTSPEPEADRRAKYLAKKVEAWETDVATRARHWSVLKPLDCLSKNHVTFVKLDDDSVLSKGDNPNTDTYTISFLTDAKNITAIRLEALPDPSLPGGGPGRGVIMSDGDFLLSEIGLNAAPWNKRDAAQPVGLADASQDFAADGRFASTALDGKMDTGWSIKGAAGKAHEAVFNTSSPIAGFDGGTLLTLTMDQVYVHNHILGRFRVSVTSDSGPAHASGVPADLESALLLQKEARSATQNDALKAFFLSVAPELAAANKAIDERRAALPSLPKTLTLEEREDVRVTNIHHRGEFLSPREAVTPGVPAVLPPVPSEAPRNRLTFARWLVSDSNPLTARVEVNRLWQEYFGRGIVVSVEDFGARGEEPTHPQLLDWLALEFEHRGWSIKELTRIIVTSATYRQSSRVSPELLAADPHNEWLGRGARFRVDAEIVRDIGLETSGLLNPKIGGPSEKLPVPENLLTLVYDANWQAATGKDLYRRGLYTYWKRTLPFPIATAFDAPARDATCTRRMRSNTPLQALTLLNDPAFMDFSRATARRVLTEGGADPQKRIDYAFMVCLARLPDDSERQWVQAFCEQQTAKMADDTAAKSVAASDKLPLPDGVDVHTAAAWTLVCRALLNLDETITRG